MTTILFITGTDTGVGKTQVTAGIAASLRGSYSLWKPIQTGTTLGSTDADSYRLKYGSGTDQREEDIVSITLPDPLAPWMAAERASQSIDYQALVLEGQRRKKEARILLVEGAGGLAVPLTDNKLIVNLTVDLGLRILLVARPTLGTVNHTLLSISYAKQHGLQIAGIILNGYLSLEDPALAENVQMIEHYGGIPVIGTLPWFPCTASTEEEWILWREKWSKIVSSSVDIPRILPE